MHRSPTWKVMGVAALCAGGVAASASSQSQVTGSGDVLPAQADGSGWVVGGQLVVGDTGVGGVVAQSSGDVHSAGLIVGRQATGVGAVTLSGNGTNLDTTGDLVLGEAGVGRLRAFDFARVTTSPWADLHLGSSEGGYGELELNTFARVDVGRHVVVNGRVDEQGIASVALDGGARLRVGVEDAGGDFLLNETGSYRATVSAAGEGTLIDVADLFRVGGGGPATVELFDGAVAVAGRMELGAGAHGALVVDDALVSVGVLTSAVLSSSQSTLMVSDQGRLQVGSGGIALGDGRAAWVVQGAVTSVGRIDLAGSTSSQSHRVELVGGDAELISASWLGIGGFDETRRARLELQGGTVSASTFAVIEAGGTLAGAGVVDLGDRLTVRGTVETSGGVLLIDAPNSSRFQNGTLAARYFVNEVDDDQDALTPSVIQVGRGVLRFASEARLDGELHLLRSDNRPDLLVPMYEPWTLIDTVDDSAVLNGIFDTVSGVRVGVDTAIAVTYSDHTVKAQRALFGDANLDGWIEQADLDAVLGHWGSTTAHWALGDFNGDGQVHQADLDAVLSNWGGPVSPAVDRLALPEPGLSLFWLAVIAGLARTRVCAGGC